MGRQSCYGIQYDNNANTNFRPLTPFRPVSIQSHQTLSRYYTTNPQQPTLSPTIKCSTAKTPIEHYYNTTRIYTTNYEQPFFQLPTKTFNHKPKVSRRKIQRKKKRILRKKIAHLELKSQQYLYNREEKIAKHYGFLSNPNKSPTHNFNRTLNKISTETSNYNTNPDQHDKQSLLSLQPKNLSVHNLCHAIHPPPGINNLLGLGLKYCIATPKPNPDIKQCLRKMAYKIRTKHYLLEKNTNISDNYIPQLYIKLTNWNPPPTTEDTENRLTLFEKLLTTTTTINRSNRSPFTNLTYNQKQTLQTLKKNSDFIIIPTDKNLGPAILTRQDYISQCLSEHLLTNNYQQLSDRKAVEKINTTKSKLIQIFNEHKHHLKDAETTYFLRSFKTQHRTPIFYGMPKVHKKPMKLRPVVSCINSFSSIFSNWLDYRMKELLFLIPSYIKNSNQLLDELQVLKLPPNAKLFTADATAMYTNIDTETGIQAFHKIFQLYNHLIPKDFPKDMFLRILRTVMENNVFKFGDTFWLQTQGTAMGTPAAPLYSILTFGFHENTALLPIFQSNLIYYKRFIDDIFGIWLDQPGNTSIQSSPHDKTWIHFKNNLNQFGALRWNVEPLTTSTTFLDLSLSIKEGRITTTTFQKPLNLYLYIPPLSAHPPSCLKGLISGEIYRYWKQNTEETDFISITTNFVLRLLQRGHQLENLRPLLQSAAANIEYINIRNRTDRRGQDDTMYIHWPFHPTDISKNTIRKLYNQTLQGHDGFKDLKMAISRPKNLRDILCKTDLPNIKNKNVSDVLNHLQSQDT